VQVRLTRSVRVSAERSLLGPASVTRHQSSARYLRACPDNARWTKVTTLNSTRRRTGSQCSWRRTGEMWSHRRVPVTNRAAAFWIDWRRSIRCRRTAKHHQCSSMSHGCRESAIFTGGVFRFQPPCILDGAADQGAGVCVCAWNGADSSAVHHNDLQLVKFNACNQNADDNDDFMNPSTPITSVSVDANSSLRRRFCGVAQKKTVKHVISFFTHEVQ